MTTPQACELCEGPGGTLLVAAEKWRVVAVEGADARYTGFCRVIWNNHVREMTDLDADDRTAFMQAVFQVEAALRLSLNPDKLNLASLGNMTPHLHWHVIPRFVNDGTFPKPIWAVTPQVTPTGDSLSSAPATNSPPSWHDAIRDAFR